MLAAFDPGDRDRWGEGLALAGGGLDGADGVHAGDDLAEGGEALTIDVAAAAEVEFGLVIDADEEVGDGGVGGGPAHRDGAVEVAKAGDAGALERDRRALLGLAGQVDAALDDLDRDLVVRKRLGVARISDAEVRNFDFEAGVRLVIEADGAVESAAVVETAVDI